MLQVFSKITMKRTLKSKKLFLKKKIKYLIKFNKRIQRFEKLLILVVFYRKILVSCDIWHWIGEFF